MFGINGYKFTLILGRRHTYVVGLSLHGNTCKGSIMDKGNMILTKTFVMFNL